MAPDHATPSSQSWPTCTTLAAVRGEALIHHGGPAEPHSRVRDRVCLAKCLCVPAIFWSAGSGESHVVFSVLRCFDHRNEHAMARTPGNPDHTPVHLGVRVGDRGSAHRADRLAPGPQQVRTHAVGDVVVLEVTGPLSTVVQELDLAIQLALADAPRAVVCDLTGVLDGAEPGVLEVLTTCRPACARLSRDPGGRGQPRPPGSQGAGC